MGKGIITTVIVILIVVLAIDIYHWGICFHHRGGLSISDTYDETFEILPEQEMPFLTIGSQNSRDVIIPFVLHLYLLDVPPYDINVMIHDESQSMKRMVIDAVSVDYIDGQKERFELDWQKNFTKSFLLGRVNDANVEIPIMRLEETIPEIVEQRESCTVKLIGHFEDTAGNKIKFETNDYFEYEPTYWEVYWFGGSF